MLASLAPTKVEMAMGFGTKGVSIDMMVLDLIVDQSGCSVMICNDGFVLTVPLTLTAESTELYQVTLPCRVATLYSYAIYWLERAEAYSERLETYRGL